MAKYSYETYRKSTLATYKGRGSERWELQAWGYRGWPKEDNLNGKTSYHLTYLGKKRGIVGQAFGNIPLDKVKIEVARLMAHYKCREVK